MRSRIRTLIRVLLEAELEAALSRKRYEGGRQKTEAGFTLSGTDHERQAASARV